LRAQDEEDCVILPWMRGQPGLHPGKKRTAIFMQKNGGGWVQTNDSPLQFLGDF